MPSDQNAEQLLLNSEDPTKCFNGKNLNVDPHSAALTLTDEPRGYTNRTMRLLGESNAFGCPSKDGVQLFWGTSVHCENGTRVALFPSKHILMQRRGFFDNAEAKIAGGEASPQTSWFGIELSKRDAAHNCNHKPASPWIPPTYPPVYGNTFPPGQAPPHVNPYWQYGRPQERYVPPCPKCEPERECGHKPRPNECVCGKPSCPGDCLGADCGCKLSGLLCPAKWGGLFDCVKPEKPDANCHAPPHYSPRHYYTECYDPSCYCQDPRFYHPHNPHCASYWPSGRQVIPCPHKK